MAEIHCTEKLRSMTYSRNGLFIILRVVFLTVFIIASVISYYETALIVTPIMFAVLAFISSVELIWYLQGLERSMTRFLLSIKHHDFSRHYKNLSQNKELQAAYELITQSFENLETQKHADYRLLQTVSEHIRIGLVCYDSGGVIMFANKTIKEMLKIEALSKMESLLPNHSDIYYHMVNEKPISGILVSGENEQKLLLKTESFSLQSEGYKLASLYDIKSTLDTNELESYQKLMKVMTHEIMNSATPILSLIQVVNKKLIHEGKVLSLSDLDQQNIAISLSAIETQTQGVLKFVEAYRKINKEISPNTEWISVERLIEPITTLLIDPLKINFSFKNQVKQKINVDPGLISQTILNLLKNAIEAVADVTGPRISLTAEKSNEHLSILIEDNGNGISAEHLSEIFVPFFSTKRAGSGIGLALSRKIVNAHGGSLIFIRTEKNATQFRILLPKEVFTNV